MKDETPPRSGQEILARMRREQDERERKFVEDWLRANRLTKTLEALEAEIEEIMSRYKVPLDDAQR